MKTIAPFTDTARIEFPIDPRLSENKRLTRNYRADRFISTNDYRDAKAALSRRMWAEWRHCAFKPKTKTRVTIFVHRPDLRGDTQNFVKGILDAVAGAIGVDDRYFAHSVDWEMSKKGTIVVEVTQHD